MAKIKPSFKSSEKDKVESGKAFPSATENGAENSASEGKGKEDTGNPPPSEPKPEVAEPKNASSFQKPSGNVNEIPGKLRKHT